MATLDAKVALGGGATTPSLNQTLGSIYLGGLDVKVNGNSYVDIYNGRTDGTQGVTMAFDVRIDSLKLATLSWTDADGFANGVNSSPTTPYSNTLLAGSVGLINTDIEGLTVVGPVTIDVATDTTTAHGGVANTTFVRLGFAGTTIGMDTLDTTVAIGPEKTLTSAKTQILGTLYMNSLSVVASGSADIYAHSGSGVSIDFAAQVNMTLATLSWGDSDGITGGPTSAGFVGLKTLAITGLGLSGNTTIDVATVATGNTSALPVGTTFVRIGFNNLNVHMTSMTADVKMGSAKTLTAVGSETSQTLGSIYMGGLTTNMTGTVDIYAHSATSQGVVIGFNLTPTNIHFDAMSWGDADGVVGTANAGYVGLKTFDITGLQVSGKVSIDVATVDPMVTPSTPFILMYAGYPTHLMGYFTNATNFNSTFVHIGLGTGNGNDDPNTTASIQLTVGSLATDVVLANNNALTTNPGTLGSIYVGGMVAKVNGWVDIAAH
jgi:hypothetical protein